MKPEMGDSNSEMIRVLLIEDNPADARLIREVIADVGQTWFTLEETDQLQAGLGCLDRGDIELVLLDLSLLDSGGLDTLVRV